MTGWACDFIDRQVQKDQPFLLHLCHYLVHSPITAQRRLVPKYTRRLKKIHTDQDNLAYATMVQAMDDSVGRVVGQLKRLGQLDNTLIIFTSDNGGYTGKEVTSNYPLMGGKSFSYEGAYRVPFIAQWKGVIPPGQTSDQRVIGMDVYPTILEAAGLALDAEQHADGVSLMGEMTHQKMGVPLEQRPLYFHHPHYTHASSPHSIIIENDYKLIRYYNDAAGRYALFNLNQDPTEQHDLSATETELVQQLDEKLTAYLNETDSEMPIAADSDAGRQLLALHQRGENKGYNNSFKDHTEVMNKQTEHELAMQERAVQEQKLEGSN